MRLPIITLAYLETDIDPYGQGSMKAWVYVQEALVLLINTALSGPMKIEKPAMPSNQPILLAMAHLLAHGEL